MLADIPSSLVPLVGGLVDQSYEGVEHGIARQELEHDNQETQQEDDPKENQEQVLGRDRGNTVHSESIQTP